jgi:hypothetical protein
MARWEPIMDNIFPDYFMRCPNCDGAVRIPFARLVEFPALNCGHASCGKALDRRRPQVPRQIQQNTGVATTGPSADDLQFLRSLRIGWEAPSA